ncbi:negative regulation of protein localization to cell cortex [Mactra antiquata]
MSNIIINNPAGATEGLPKQFVTSLRILFDILDEDRTGFVRLRDIETRWHEEGVSGLPSGVIEALRKVAPRNGRLSFDGFVTGLKLALLKNNGPGFVDKPQVSLAQVYNSHKRSQNVPQTGVTSAVPHVNTANVQKSSQTVKTQKSPDYVNIGPPERKNPTNQNTGQQRYRSQPKMGSQAVVSNSNNLVAVEPNNALQSQNIELRNQIYSREQMQQAQMKMSSKKEQTVKFESTKRSPPGYGHRHNVEVTHPRKDTRQILPPQRPKSATMENQRPSDYFHNGRYSDFLPGRPDRPPPYRRPNDIEVPPVLPPKDMNSRIMNELKNWQREHKTGQLNNAETSRMRVNHSDSKLNDQAVYVNIEQIRQHEDNKKSTTTTTGSKSIRRQNSRRHTLSSGIDYNVIRRMKQLELEKDVLLQGLEIIDRAREWYMKQITTLSEKQNYAEKTSYSDVALQSHQERVDFIRSRITDVNLNLKTLMETSESGFPAHMNLAIRSTINTDDNSVKWLKDQNKQLTQEVGVKSEKITQLEKEKATLIRDLFEARSKHKTNYDDTTFM